MVLWLTDRAIVQGMPIKEIFAPLFPEHFEFGSPTFEELACLPGKLDASVQAILRASSKYDPIPDSFAQVSIEAGGQFGLTVHLHSMDNEVVWAQVVSTFPVTRYAIHVVVAWWIKPLQLDISE